MYQIAAEACEKVWLPASELVSQTADRDDIYTVPAAVSIITGTGKYHQKRW